MVCSLPNPGRVAKTYDRTTNGCVKEILAWVRFMQNFPQILSKIWVTFVIIGTSSFWQARLTPLLPPGSGRRIHLFLSSADQLAVLNVKYILLLRHTLCCFVANLHFVAIYALFFDKIIMAQILVVQKIRLFASIYPGLKI